MIAIRGTASTRSSISATKDSKSCPFKAASARSKSSTFSRDIAAQYRVSRQVSGLEGWKPGAPIGMMPSQTRWPGSGLAPMNVIDPLSRDWLPRGRLARRTRGLLLGGVWLRCVTWRQARRLDEQLAFGTDPITSDELSLRAGQLASARSRGRFACVLRGAVELADAPFDPSRMGPPVLRRAEVQENRGPLLELANRLRDGGFLGVQGLAITSLLVGDGVSPLYSKATRGSLKESVNRALLALGGSPAG
jgi:hypothetical protein